jgi:hypothetical protein
MNSVLSIPEISPLISPDDFQHWLRSLLREPDHVIDLALSRLLADVRHDSRKSADLDRCLADLSPELSDAVFGRLQPPVEVGLEFTPHHGCVEALPIAGEDPTLAAGGTRRPKKVPAHLIRSGLAMLSVRRSASTSPQPAFAYASIPIKTIRTGALVLPSTIAEVRTSPMLVAPDRRGRSHVFCNVQLRFLTDDPHRLSRGNRVKVQLLSKGSRMRFTIDMVRSSGTTFEGELDAKVNCRIEPMEIDRRLLEAEVIERPLQVPIRQPLAESEASRPRTRTRRNASLKLVRSKSN